MDNAMQFLTILLAIVAAVGACLATLLKIMQLIGKVDEYHSLVNSRLDEFIEVTKRSSHAEGVADERERKRTEP